MTKKKFEWDQIRRLRDIPRIGNAQEITIRRASTLAAKTAEIELKLERWINKDGNMSAVIRTLIDEAAGPYLLENPDTTTRSLTAVSKSRRHHDHHHRPPRRHRRARAHRAQHRRPSWDTPDEIMYEASSLKAIVTNDCTITIDELTSLLAQVYDEADPAEDNDDRSAEDRFAVETRMAAEAALIAPRTPPTQDGGRTAPPSRPKTASSRRAQPCFNAERPELWENPTRPVRKPKKAARTTRRRAEQQARGPDSTYGRATGWAASRAYGPASQPRGSRHPVVMGMYSWSTTEALKTLLDTRGPKYREQTGHQLSRFLIGVMEQTAGPEQKTVPRQECVTEVPENKHRSTGRTQNRRNLQAEAHPSQNPHDGGIPQRAERENGAITADTATACQTTTE